MSDLIGHDNTKKRIEVALNSATTRNTCIPHILLAGSAGCGKTTTARWLAELGDYDFLPISPLSMNSRKAVYELMDKLNTVGYNEVGDRVAKIKPTIIFFDEIHQMPVIGQEILGIAMERFDLESDEANKLIWLPYFSVVGATTDDGILTKPFRDRFKTKFIYEPYSDKDMYSIVEFHAAKRSLLITPKAIRNITRRSRGVPRTMVNYLETIRDYMIAAKSYVITYGLTQQVFESIGIDETGLTSIDVALLKSLYISKKAIGLENLSIVTNESVKTISQTIEPYLIRRGLMIRTGKGREITSEGKDYLEAYGHLNGPGNSKPKKVFIDVAHKRK